MPTPPPLRRAGPQARTAPSADPRMGAPLLGSTRSGPTRGLGGALLLGAALAAPPARAQAAPAPAAPAEGAPRVEPPALQCAPGEPLEVRVVDPVAGAQTRRATCPPCGAGPEVPISFLIDRPNGDRGHAVLRTTPAPCAPAGPRLDRWGPLAALGLLGGALALLRAAGPR